MDAGALYWLRPLWLWALLALPPGWWLATRRARRGEVWRGVVDAHLLPHLLVAEAAPAHRHGRWLAAAAYVLAILALAGPSWRQVEQPLWQSHAPLVVALDLSTAIDRRDLPPSRLAQARAKLATLLQQRRGGQVGLVAYAGDAFTVAPLTADANNVAVFLDALSSDVMPVDGQRIDRAIGWSVKLLRQAGFTQGDIVVMGDHATDADVAASAHAAAAGFNVSVLGVGAATGVAGGFDEVSLRRLASAGNGRYQRITLDDADLRALGVLAPRGTHGAGDAESGGRHWLDEGYWLLPAVMLLALPLFRRGAAVAILVLAVGWPWGTVQAADWWRRADQVQHAAMEAATQRYRQGDFAGAAQGFAQVDSADAHYNRGNALARAGRYQEAIRAYDAALQRAPGMADALANRRAVEAAMKRKPPPGGKPTAGKGRPEAGDGRPGERGSGGAHQGGSGDPASAQKQTGDSRPSPTGGDAPPPKPIQGADAAAQAKADAAQRERMRQARARDGEADETGKTGQGARPAKTETAAERERRIANEAWLRRVPDEPGGLLREKFRLEYQRRMQQGGSSR